MRELNISLLMERALKELETARNTAGDVEKLAEIAKRRKTAIKLAELLMRKMLIKCGLPTTKEYLEAVMKTETIKNAAEATDLYCTTEEVNFFISSK